MASHGSILSVVALAVCTSGCALLDPHGDLNYKTVLDSPNRDQRAAQAKIERAMEFYEQGNLERAEPLLQEALLADVTSGPAHNALGKLYFDQQKFYLAAWEFEYVINLMPERPEPHNNLGLVMEAVGKLDEAIQSYQTALEIEPDNPDYLGNSVRARLRRGERDLFVRQQLEQLIFIDSRPDWVAWANERLALDEFDTNELNGTPLPNVPSRETPPARFPGDQQEALPPPASSSLQIPLEAPRNQVDGSSEIQPRPRQIPQPPTDATLR